MSQREKEISEFVELFKIRLEQLMTKDEVGLVKATFWKNLGNSRVKIAMSVENK